MGDHRASVRIAFEFHGKVHEMDSWINWCPDLSECNGVDQRVIDFFRNATTEGLATHDRHMKELYGREHTADIERLERAELARLQSKYAK